MHISKQNRKKFFVNDVHWQWETEPLPDWKKKKGTHDGNSIVLVTNPVPRVVSCLPKSNAFFVLCHKTL